MTADSRARLPRGPMMVDVAGLTLTAEEQGFLQHPTVGAVILFNRNFSSPRQITNLVRHIKSLRHPALLVAVDQEGGRVQRFRQGFYNLPPLLSLGECYDRNPRKSRGLAYNAGLLMATELLQVDVDFSFAPVLDVANLKSKVIGDRGFHQNPEIIANIALAYIDGMNTAGMQATGKHFPGHGGVLADSHQEVPVDNRNLDTLIATDLKPYYQLAPKLGAIMTAHISFPTIDKQLPTFSEFWINNVLRKTIGFDGMVFSDDLSMKGAHGVGNPSQRAKHALAAGCDMVLICNDPEAARETARLLVKKSIPNQRRLQRMVGTGNNVTAGEIAKLAKSLTSLQMPA